MLNLLIHLQGNKETGKMNNIKYNKLTTMRYLKRPLFNQDESSLLLRLRTRCVNSIRNDFGGMYFDKNCPVNINCNTLDTLQHLLVCQTVQESIDTPIIARHRSIYEDLFSEDIFRQQEVTTLYQLLLETRERILSSPAADAGPLHCGDT